MKRILIAMLTALLVAVTAGAGPITEIDGVTHVKNGAKPSDGVETMSLRELWRAGGDDDEVFFGLITQVLVDDDGNIYLLDTQLSEVQVYSPDGENIDTLSREGDGPGEVRAPVDMFFTPEGNLGLMQSFPGKIVVIDLQGDPVGDYKPGGDAPSTGFLVLQDAKSYGDSYLLCGIMINPNETQTGQIRSNFLAAYDADGIETIKYLEKIDDWDFTNFELHEKDQHFVNFRRWTVGPDGRIYGAADRNAYRIQVFNADGTPDRVIERDYASYSRDADEKAFIDNAMNAAKRQFGFDFPTSVEDTEPDITRLTVRSDGTLWVLASQGQRGQDEGVIATYDVFDAEGRFTKQVRIGCEGDGGTDGIIFAGEDRLVVITGFMDAVMALQGGGGGDDDEEEPTPMEIICYAID